jgi:tetratricopeptide (TPR) repeat protein
VRRPWAQAKAALDRFDLVAAATCLDRYLEHQPDDAAAWFLAGRTARRLGRTSKAQEYLERCQRLGGVSDATRLEWDLLRVQQGDLDNVHLRLRMTITPDHPDALLVLEALARGYLRCDRLRDAVEACDLWLNQQPNHPWPYLWRGGVFEQLGNYDHALEDYRLALQHAPDDRDVRLALAKLYERMRQPGPAAEQFEWLHQRDPADEQALLGLAACRLEQGQPKEALTLLEEVRADSVGARVQFLRGRAALQQLDAAAAERWLTLAAQHDPHDVETLQQLNASLRGLGKLDEADRLAARLEILHKDYARLAELIRIIYRNPKDAPPWHETGMLALKLGRTDDGVRWLQGALRVSADHRPTHAALADHFERQGDPRADYHRKKAQAP